MHDSRFFRRDLALTARLPFAMEKYPLKAWEDESWQRKLSKTLTVSRVDEDIPTDKQRRNRKPWYVALTRQPHASAANIEGLPKGHTLLLSEHDVLALLQYTNGEAGC